MSTTDTIAKFDVRSNGDPKIRTVSGEGTAVMLVNAGEGFSYAPHVPLPEPTEDVQIVATHVEREPETITTEEYADSVGKGMIGLMGDIGLGKYAGTKSEPVAVFEPEEVIIDLDQVFAEEPSPENVFAAAKPDYSGEKVGVLRKLASERGFRKATGLDPYKQATREQLLAFIASTGA